MIGFGNSKSTSDVLDQIWFGGEKFVWSSEIGDGQGPSLEVG